MQEPISMLPLARPFFRLIAWQLTSNEQYNNIGFEKGKRCILSSSGAKLQTIFLLSFFGSNKYVWMRKGFVMGLNNSRVTHNSLRPRLLNPVLSVRYPFCRLHLFLPIKVPAAVQQKLHQYAKQRCQFNQRMNAKCSPPRNSAEAPALLLKHGDMQKFILLTTCLKLVTNMTLVWLTFLACGLPNQESVFA